MFGLMPWLIMFRLLVSGVIPSKRFGLPIFTSLEKIFWLPPCRLLADYAKGLQPGIAEANPCPWMVDGFGLENVEEFGRNG